MECLHQPGKGEKLIAILEGIQYPTADDLIRHFYKRCHHTIQVDSFRLTHEGYTGVHWKSISEDVVLDVRDLHIGSEGADARLESRELERMLNRMSAEHMTLHVHVKYEEDKEIGAEANEWTSLEELKLLKAHGDSDTRTFWTSLWKRCRHIEKLEVALVDEAVTQGLTDLKLVQMPNLDTIHLRRLERGARGLDDGQIAALLSSSSKGWKVVKVSHNLRVREAAQRALAHHFQTLQELIVDDSSGFTEEYLVQVLSSCPNLRSLVTIDNEYYHKKVSFTSINADAFIDRDPSTGNLRTWACEASLKVLKVKIGGIPRPDLIRRGIIQETHSGEGNQKLVCERLGRLVNLKTLWLGHNPKIHHEAYRNGSDCEFQYDCLEMTLESGLDKLSGLKMLRELSISGMMVNMRAKDVQWMAEHWKVLRRIHGDILLYETGVLEWLAAYCPQVDCLGKKVDRDYDDHYGDYSYDYDLYEDHSLWFEPGDPAYY